MEHEVKRSARIHRVALVAILAASALVAGCGGGGRAVYRQGEAAAQREEWDTAVLSYAKALSEEPANVRYRVALERAKLRAASDHFDRGKRYLGAGQLELALKELQQAVILDPANQYAAVELEKVASELERRRKSPSDFEKARSEADRRAADLAPPKLDPAANVPIQLKFPDSTIQEVYDMLSKTSGINFLYDDKVTPSLKNKLSIELTNVTFEKAMDILMLMNKHFYKVIDRHTILVADDNRQKHTEYDDHVIRTFYLSNAETTQIQTVLRSLLETRRVAENKELNAITLKDTPEKIKVAERIIKANDKAKGEVIVDIELLEINRTRSQKLGLDLSGKSLSLGFKDGKSSIALNNLDSLKLKSNWSVGVIPSVIFDFLKSDSDSKTIARPQIRILEGDQGKITIGDRVPIPATTFNTSQTIGGNIVPVTSFTYQNVGIIVEVKPRVHHNKEVTLELKTEISALAGEVAGTGGVSQPIIGTRTVETTIRLQDGETNLLAGLIKEDERTSLAGVPGLTDIPILRRLFGTTGDNASNTDIVLSITPHIVRVPNIEPIDLVPLWVGTEEQVELRGVARNALGESPFEDGYNPWEEIQSELDGSEDSAIAKAPAGGSQPDVKLGSAAKGGGKPGPAAGPAAGAGAGAGARQAPGRTAPAQSPPAGRGKQGTATGGSAPNAPAAANAPVPVPTPVPNEGALGGNGEPIDMPGEDDAAKAPAPPPEEPKPTSVAQVRMSADRPQVASGEGVTIDVFVAGAEGVGEVNFQLRYDPKILRFAPPLEPGEFLAQGGASVSPQGVEGAEGGLVVVSLSRSGQTGASGAGRLVRLNFVALAPGSANFGFAMGTVRATDGQVQPATFRAANVEVTP